MLLTVGRSFHPDFVMILLRRLNIVIQMKRKIVYYVSSNARLRVLNIYFELLISGKL